MALRGSVSSSIAETGSFGKLLGDGSQITNVSVDLPAEIISSSNGTLHVNGLITQGGVGSGTSNIMIGQNAGGAPGNTGTIRSVFIGQNAASKITTGDRNVSIGFESGGATATAVGSHNQFVAIGAYAASKIKDSSQGFVMIGDSAGYSSVTAQHSIHIGRNAGIYTLSGSYNTFIGSSAGSSAGGSNGETPNNNIAIGVSTFGSAGDATYNVAVGDGALKNIAGNNNVAIGTSALQDHVDGDSNIAIGNLAMSDAGQDGGRMDNQIAIGQGALRKIDSFGAQYANIAIGQETMNSMVSSSTNIVMGYRSMYQGVKMGGSNTVIGNSAGYAASGTSFHANVVIGDYAGYNLNSSDNVFIGEYAGNDAENANSNVVIGSGAAKLYNTFETNTTSVLIGYKAHAGADGNTNEIAIGSNITGQGSNTVTLGNASVTEVHMAQDGAAEIFANGTINTSDRRFKENIDDSDLGLEFINKVRPVSYTFINDRQKDGKTKYGIIAQEVQEVLKEINNEDFAGIKDDNPDKLGADYVQFIAPLIKSVQELTEKVEEQQKEIEKLKKQ